MGSFEDFLRKLLGEMRGERAPTSHPTPGSTHAEIDIPMDRFEVIRPPIEPASLAENAVFRVGYPLGWFETTATEPPIEGNPALVVLRRDERTGPPGDVKSRGVIRCFSSMRASKGEFFEAAEHIVEARARALQAHPVEQLRFVRVDEAPCYMFQVEGTQLIHFQSVPSAITEVHLFHDGELLMMQLESDPELHPAHRQVLGTVLGTLTWR